MSAITETLHAGAFLVSEEENYYSRDQVVIESGQGVLQAGTVLGQRVAGAASSAVKASGANTGNGALTLDATTPVLANATPGVYTVRCTVAGTNAATFRVSDPKGTVLGDTSFNGSGASASFADRIKFAIADGATDFIVGDGFDITVAAGSGKYIACPNTANDGSDVACAVLFGKVDATSADKVAVAVKRVAQVRISDLSWSASVVSASSQAAKLAQLAAVGVIGR